MLPQIEVELQKLSQPYGMHTKIKFAVDNDTAQKTAKLLSNLTFLANLCLQLCSPKTQIRIARDWQLKTHRPQGQAGDQEGAHPSLSFRTTWTAGWFLDRYN